MNFQTRRPFLRRALILALLGLLLPATGLLAATQELCLRYPVETVDSGLGSDYEDYYSLNDSVWPYWKARGAAYQLLDPADMSLIQQGYASDDNGCFTIDESLLPAGNNVVLVFYLDALLHNHIRVRARSGTPSNCDDDPFADHSAESSFCQPMVCAGETGPLMGPGKKYLDYFCNIPELTLQALAAFPAYWWHQFDTGALDYDFTITLRHRDGCSSIPEYPPCSNAGYYMSGDDLEILVNIDDQTEHKYRQKFLVGHEVGHAIEEAYQTARFGTMDYLYGSYTQPVDAACDSAGELHALTSREYTSAAINEGFAHFVSTDTYNDHGQTTGRFTYYKDDLGFPRDIAVEGDPAFDMANPHNSNRYAERVCTATASNVGTELDWLRFFWDLHTVGGGADDEHENLLQLRVDAAFQGGPAWGDQNGYDLLEDNACNGPAGAQYFQAAFLTFAGSDDAVGGNGVEPTGMVPACP